MNNAVHTEPYRGCTIAVYHDQDAGNPRKEWDEPGHMVCWHSRYNLGDEHSYRHPSDYEEDRETLNLAIELPLYLYDHSGLTMRTGPFGCPWDSGQVGWIYLTREEVKKEYGWTRLTKDRLEKLRQSLESAVKTYDTYLRGNVYGYVAEGPDGEHIDSCWGFYGDSDDEYMLGEAKAAIDYHLQKSAEQAHASAECMIGL